MLKALAWGDSEALLCRANSNSPPPTTTHTHTHFFFNSALAQFPEK